LISVKKSALLSRMKLDNKTLTKYIKEHEDSSIIPGVKWGQIDPDDWGLFREMYEMIRGFVEEEMFSGKAWDVPFNFGARQRADQEVEPGVTHYELEVTRTRVVMFNLALSTMFAVVPDKKGFYQEMVDTCMDLFEINDHLITPMTHGGEVYGAACSALNGSEDVTIVLGDDVNIFKGGTQYAFDGVNWETQVGTILGKPFHGTKSYFGGMYHVPSGVFDTSLDDTIASMWVYSQSEDMKKGQDIAGVMEREEMDEKVNFMLGLAYQQDPNMPRLQGLKLNQDKADAAVPLPPGRHLELVAKTPEDEAERWYLGYHGTTQDGGTLLDFLEKISPEDFRGGEVSEYVSKGSSYID